MDPVTKKNAHEKLKKMDKNIAYPDELLDRAIVDAHFANVEVSDEDYLGNELALSK